MLPNAERHQKSAYANLMASLSQAQISTAVPFTSHPVNDNSEYMYIYILNGQRVPKMQPKTTYSSLVLDNESV